MVERLQIAIIGESPLICNRFLFREYKVRKQDTPETLFNAARYRLSDGSDGIPALALKQCIATGIGKVAGISTAKAKGVICVIANDRPDRLDGYDLCRIIAPSGPEMRVDKVMLGDGDPRYRAQYWPWAIDFSVEYVSTVCSQAQLLRAIAIAGVTVGLLEWRPGKSGPYGTFRLGTADELARLAPISVDKCAA